MYRKIHTYVLNKIHIDNIAVVLPLVTWLTHVLSACDVTCFTLSRKRNSKMLTSGRQQVCKHRSMDAACTGVWKTEVSQWGLGAGTSQCGLGTKHKSSKTSRKQMQTTCTYTMSERWHRTWGDRRESGGMGVYHIPADLGASWASSAGSGAPVNDFWSKQFCIILRVLLYSGSWLLAIITPKYNKIENITGAGKVMLHASSFSCGSNASERVQPAPD